MRFVATLGLAAALLLADAAARAADGAATPWPTAGWETSTPEAEGMSSAALADLVDFGAASDMDSLLVVRHGRIVAEAYYAPFRRGQQHLVNSVTKAVVGTLVGIAVQEERIGRLDQPVVDLFFEREIARLDAAKKAITIESLLDSNSGLDWNEPLSDAPPETMLQMARSRDWVGFVLDRPMAQPPGRAFAYDSGTWHLLSAILTKKTGMDTLAYARQALFRPLGIAEATWAQDPQGIRIGGYGLFLQPRDMAKIGYLYLHHGRVGGRAAVAAVMERARRSRLGRHGLRHGADVSLRQRLVDDSRQARLHGGRLPAPADHRPARGRRRRRRHRQAPLSVPAADRPHRRQRAIGDSPLPADAAGVARLAERVRDAAVEQATPVMAPPPLAQTISGRTWKFESNPSGVRSLKLDLVAIEPRYEAVVDGFGGARAAPLRRADRPRRPVPHPGHRRRKRRSPSRAAG